jgi:hypothetical protein
MKQILRLVQWLLEQVVDDPVRLSLVLMFTATVFTIYLAFSVLAKR